MNRYILFIALMVGVLLAMCQQAAFGDVSANEQNAAVTMTITKLQVNDQTLELSWKIVNHSDHDVWILDAFSYPKYPYEVYLAEDNQTLMIRRRLDVPTVVTWFAPPEGRYVRLRVGEEKTETFSLTMPVNPTWIFSIPASTAKYASRLVLEIGFYDEDLPGMIHDILQVADMLSCERLDLFNNYPEITKRFFKGVWVDYHLGGLSKFNDYYYKDPNLVLIPYTSQDFPSEQVLRATIDGVSIPYGEVPATDEPPQSDTEPAGVTMALTGLDVNDTKLELSYKIKNNTDHDVWICDSVNTERTYNIEVYLDEDAQTLVIRKRLDIVPEFVWSGLPNKGRYVRLQPAQEYSESLSLDVPVGPSLLYADKRANAEFASRLVIEIGFYNEDVLKRIRSIIEVAERFNCASVELRDFESDFMRCYFKGLLITWLFGGLSHFDEVYTDTDVSELLTAPTYQLIGEQVLRIEVDGVHIPYDEFASPLNPDPPIPKGLTCFLAETPVWVDGMIVPISKVVAGQAVRRSLCTTPGPWPIRVEKVQEHTGIFECRDIVLESGNHIGVVGAHCFMLDSGEWIAAQDLKSGLSLRTLQGTVRIKSVTVRAAPYTGKVYNLKIKNSDEYIVGRDAVIVRDY